jgi:hypothetical protein
MSAEGRLREALASGDAHTAVVQLKHLSRSLHSAQLTNPAQARRHGFMALSHHPWTMVLQHGGAKSCLKHFQSAGMSRAPGPMAMQCYFHVCLKVTRLGALAGAVWHC